MLGEFTESDSDRIEERRSLARTLAENGHEETLVLSRETISSFGVKEWLLIEELDRTDAVEVPDDCHSAAERLAEHGVITLYERDDDVLVARQESDSIVARVL